jgi:hypothetical protein
MATENAVRIFVGMFILVSLAAAPAGRARDRVAVRLNGTENA